MVYFVTKRCDSSGSKSERGGSASERSHSVRKARERRKRLELGNLSSQPCGLTNPARQSLASGRKRVLRGGRKLPLRSVDSESQCRAIEPRNLLSRERPLLTQAGAAGGAEATPDGVHRSYRGPRSGRRDMRVAREPERPCHFRRDCRPGFRLTNSRLIRSSRPELAGTNRGRDDGIAKRRQRSRAKKLGRGGDAMI